MGQSPCHAIAVERDLDGRRHAGLRGRFTGKEREPWTTERASQDVGALSELFRRAPDPQARRFVLDHPLDALERARKRQEDSVDPRLGQAGRELLTGLLAIRQVSLRVNRRAREGIGAVPDDAVRALADAACSAEADCVAAISATRLCLSPT